MMGWMAIGVDIGGDRGLYIWVSERGVWGNGVLHSDSEMFGTVYKVSLVLL